MIRLNMIVEGQTEQNFVNQILKEHLALFHIFISVRRVETGRKRDRIYRGGMTTYLKAKRDIQRWLKEDKNQDVRFTTMFDLYRLPEDFPGFYEAGNINPQDRVKYLEDAFQKDIKEYRFFPYIQLHEYEALILTDPDSFICMFPHCRPQIVRLKELVKNFSSPELINDGEATAPSKRIINEIPDYENLKPVAGPAIAKEIGLSAIRAGCEHFDTWIKRIENLSNKKGVI